MQAVFKVPARAENIHIEDDANFIALVRVPIEPGHAEAHVQRVTKAINNYIGQLPGYISGALHVRSDEYEFLNYTEWKSEADYDAFIDSIRSGEGREKVKRDIGYEPKMIRYTYKTSVFPNTVKSTLLDSGFRVISTLGIASGNSDSVLKEWRRRDQEAFSSVPGFLSSSFHIRNDEEEVMNYSKWVSEEAYLSAIAGAFEFDDGVVIEQKFHCVKVFFAGKSLGALES